MPPALLPEEKMQLILEKLDSLTKIVTVQNRFFPKWAMATFLVMGLAHSATLVALIYIVRRLP